MSISDILASLAIVISIGLFVYAGLHDRNIDKKIDERVKKRVEEELAPYREILDAMKQKITRSPDEIAYSMAKWRYIPPDDPGQMTVINEKSE